MRLIILSFLCAWIIHSYECFPISDSANDIKLLDYESVTTSNEKSFSYELDDGQKRSETVSIMSAGPDDEEEISMKGSYSFTGSDGKIYLVEYIADKNGYQPKLMILEPPSQYQTTTIPPPMLSGNVLSSLVG